MMNQNPAKNKHINSSTVSTANQTHTLYFFAYHDVILEIDVNAKTIVAKF